MSTFFISVPNVKLTVMKILHILGRIGVVVALFASSYQVEAQRSVILDPRIATLQVVAGDNWLSMPVAALHGDVINIAFDDMTHDYHRYSYKIEHCDADWTVSKDLFTSDYLSGFNGELTIDDYDQSLNANHLYTIIGLPSPMKIVASR